MEKKSKDKGAAFSVVGHVITGFCALLFLIAAALFLVLLLKPLYYYDISYLNIVEKSGYAREEIILNYNALIHWCMPWVKAAFSLPTFPSSPNAIIHFEEVKVIFNAIFAAGILSLLLLLPLSYRALKTQNNKRFLFAGSIVLAAPTLLGVYAAVDFNKAFVLFHEVVFRNELWIFDDKTDPVITILPEAYFMHCTIVIFFVIFLGALGLFLLGRRKDL